MQRVRDLLGQQLRLGQASLERPFHGGLFEVLRWQVGVLPLAAIRAAPARHQGRSEEHTSELQSQSNLVCRLLLEKKKTRRSNIKSRRLKSTQNAIGKAVL